MNAADLARLEVAKRAYRATQPTDVEVQIGVRRARLAQSRPKLRRSFFSKGLVFVVLAIGSLAYAKPHALGELVEKVLPRPDAANAKGGARGEAALMTPPEAERRMTGSAQGASRAAVRPEPASSPVATPEGARAATPEAPTKPTAVAPRPATPAATREPAAASKAVKGAGRDAAHTALSTPGVTPAERATPPSAGAVSDWGRVGQALADGDQAEALTALNQLSESDDQRTRDKADLGRAQLLMARGDRDAACALAGSLTHRRAGSRIERAAQVLLKSCGR
jgi:hypothetical protein